MKKSRKNPVIVVVDDDSVILDCLREEIEDLGFEVITAENGRDALHLINARKKDISLVISDFIMPVMNGLELYKKTRFHKTNFVMLTGYPNDLMEKIGESHQFRLLEKPIEIEDLYRELGQYFDLEEIEIA